MDKNSTFGQIFEQGQSAIDDSTSDVANTTKNQIFGAQKTNNQNAQATAADLTNTQGSSSETTAFTSEDTKEMVKDFYSPSADNNKSQALPNDQENLVSIRQQLQQLHKDVYYDPLFAYEQKKRNTQERKAEKIEREDQENLQELQVKEQDKPAPIALQRAQTTTEMNRGVAG